MSGRSSRADGARGSARSLERARGSARSRGGASAVRALAAVAVLGAVAASGVACSRAGGNPRHGDPLRVAAAADLALAFKDVGAEFEKTTGKRVEFSFGSTGLLAKQVEEGAPFDVFAAANVSFVDDVVKAGACNGDSKQLYAKGRIVLWSKDPSALPKSLDELSQPRFSKIAIANPEHAPYGRAAVQAMKKTGVWTAAEGRAVYGENVQQTMMFAQTGNADVAVVALSLAVVSEGKYLPIDPALHEPLDQALVVCKGGHAGQKANEARSFVEFVSSPAGRAIMRRYGFLLPGESTAP